ncbi:unnamed protein product [Musa acuminata subsp. malaccensis]|uniref:(wild Malaysian banana) hypothetical protein n=1 Tax=Musa acuminata subsp. malaccensis TaxID=214687 RepID=A0A804JFX5_MUSAM|nr:PREDICTED: uncharacterized protein LOC103987619 [Musa acuminata subsp. malaccensis]CAG1846170.1 unnamed protein product [Musa acuminata subsp. malaccensis]
MASPERPLLVRAMGMRRTWVCLFLLVYTFLLYCSWSLLLSIRSWYNTASSHSSSSSSSTSPTYVAGWPALYASVLYGGVFGLLAMGAALAVAVPATLVTWITVLVLLAFAGKPRRSLVMEGRRITADITAIALKILVREGNLVAGICATVSFFALLFSSRRSGGAAGGDRDL